MREVAIAHAALADCQCVGIEFVGEVADADFERVADARAVSISIGPAACSACMMTLVSSSSSATCTARTACFGNQPAAGLARRGR